MLYVNAPWLEHYRWDPRLSVVIAQVLNGRELLCFFPGGLPL